MKRSDPQKVKISVVALRASSNFSPSPDKSSEVMFGRMPCLPRNSFTLNMAIGSGEAIMRSSSS